MRRIKTLTLSTALALAFAGCGDEENSSYSQTPDSVTGTLVLDGVAFDVTASGEWTPHINSNCKSTPMTDLELELQSGDESDGVRLLVDLLFDGEELPPMPLDATSHQVTCDGDYGDYPAALNLGLGTFTGSAPIEWELVSGTVSLTATQESSTKVLVEGELMDLVFKDRNGTAESRLSGTFTERVSRKDEVNPPDPQ